MALLSFKKVVIIISLMLCITSCGRTSEFLQSSTLQSQCEIVQNATTTTMNSFCTLPVSSQEVVTQPIATNPQDEVVSLPPIMFPKYENVCDAINNYMNNFISVYSFQDDIYTSDSDIFGYSAEGGILTEYRDSNNRLIRIKVVLFGETGKSTENYYIIDEAQALYTKLVENYSSILITRNSGDILSYSYNEYWIDNDEIYSIDRAQSILLTCDKNPISDAILKCITQH